MTSGRGRWPRADALPNATYVDGAYCGPPSAPRAGHGPAVRSCRRRGHHRCARRRPEPWASRRFAGVGAARALDYAVVDMAFVTLMSYAVERRDARARAATSVAVAAISHRLAAAPAALEAAAADGGPERRRTNSTLRRRYTGSLRFEAALPTPSARRASSHLQRCTDRPVPRGWGA